MLEVQASPMDKNTAQPFDGVEEERRPSEHLPPRGKKDCPRRVINATTRHNAMLLVQSSSSVSSLSFLGVHDECPPN